LAKRGIFNLKIKVSIEQILNNLITVGIIGAASYLAYKLAQDHLGFFSYPGLESAQVEKVANQYFKMNKMVSKACTEDFCRGVLSTGEGGMLYYFYHSPGKSFSIYPLVTEQYTIAKNSLGENPKLVYP
jgi:hypothetical protein